MNRKKEIISLLSREQIFKKVFLQLGNQRNLPYDIILLIYNFLRYQSQKEIEIIKDYHITNLYQVTLLGELNIDIHKVRNTCKDCVSINGMKRITKHCYR